MMEHTYPILFNVEQSHWWHIGRRRIIAGFVEEIWRQVTDRPPRILDVGCCTGEYLPYDDGTFDLVTALDVVEHMDDDLAGLKEMRRVLRPGGRVLLFVPTFMFLWGLQDDVSNHRRRYRLSELRRVLEQAGFEIERTTYANITFFFPILLVRQLMKITGVKAESENNINVSAMNGVLGSVFGAESWFLKRMNLPFGVSGLCVARVK